jgi:hypothetical protein
VTKKSFVINVRQYSTVGQIQIHVVNEFLYLLIVGKFEFIRVHGLFP